MPKKVLVPIADGSEEIEAVCIIDVLRRAGADVTVASVDGLQVTASRGVKIVADTLIADCAGIAFDLIALPGGIPGAEHLRDSVELIGLLRRQQEEGRLCGAICASPAVVLQHHGLLGGRKATSPADIAVDLRNAGAEWVDQEAVRDGNLITAVYFGYLPAFLRLLLEAIEEAPST